MAASSSLEGERSVYATSVRSRWKSFDGPASRGDCAIALHLAT
jgi:hypothetical protein